MARRRDSLPTGERMTQLVAPRGRGAGRAAAVSGPGRIGTPSVPGVRVPIMGGDGLRMMARAFDGLAQTANQVMNREFQIRADTVKREQSLAGTEYGAGVELDQLQLPAGDSIGDEAFRKSAMLAAGARYDVKIYDHMEELGKQFAGRPEAFRAELERRANKFLAKAPPEMQAELLQTYNRLGVGKYKELDDQRRVFERDQHRADILGAYKTYRDRAAAMALRGDWQSAREELNKLSQITVASGPVELGGAGAFSLQEIEEQSQISNELIGGQFLQGWVDRTNNPAAALAAVRSGSTGNPAADEALSVAGPQWTTRVMNALDTEVKRRESEAKAAARERQQELRFEAQMIVDNEEAAAANGEVADPGWESKVRLAYGDRAEPVIARVNHARDTAIMTTDFATMPMSQMEDIIAGRLPEGAGYSYEAKDLATMQSAAAKIIERRQKDPVTEAMRAFPSVQAALSDPATMASGFKELADIQTRVFGIRPDRVEYLTDGQANDLVQRFNDAPTADERLALLQGYTTGLQDDAIASRVLTQLEGKHLPADARFAMERLTQDDVAGARKILAGVSTKPGDLPKFGEDKAAAIDAAVDSLMADPTKASGLSAYRAYIGNQPGLFQRAAGERNALHRMTAEGVAAGKDANTAARDAAAALHGDVTVAGNDDLGYVEAPRNVDTEDMTAAMLGARQNVDLSAFAPAAPITRPGQEATGAQLQAYDFASRDYQRRVDAIRNGGIWADAEGGYALLDPATGQQIKFFTLEELMAAPRVRTWDDYRGGDPLRMDLPPDDLSGGAGNDRLDTLVNSTGGGVNPQVQVLIQRLLGRANDPTFDPKLTAEQARALGIPTAEERDGS